MLRDVREPQLVRAVGFEDVADHAVLVDHGAQVVVDRRAGLLRLAPLGLAEHRPPAQLGADPPRGPLGHGFAGLLRFVKEEPVAELRVVLVGVEQRVGAVGLDQFGVGDRLSEPAVVGAGERS